MLPTRRWHGGKQSSPRSLFPDRLWCILQSTEEVFYFVMTRYSPRLHSFISYGTFTRYRTLLIWWANIRYNECNAAPPLTARLSISSRRWPDTPSVKQASNSDDQATRNQSHLGLAELHQLAPFPNMIPWESLFLHIESSDTTKLTQRSGIAGVEWMSKKTNVIAHDSSKAEAGWYRCDWKGDLNVTNNDS